jgi:hypothetical protein
LGAESREFRKIRNLNLDRSRRAAPQCLLLSAGQQVTYKPAVRTGALLRPLVPTPVEQRVLAATAAGKRRSAGQRVDVAIEAPGLGEADAE